jgi:hypothetical protein
MRRGLLKNYTDTVCDIFVGWRLRVSRDDMPMLLSIGAGNLAINLLDGTTSLDGETITFQFAKELHDWLRGRADTDGLGWANISEAKLQVRFDFKESTTPNRRRCWQTRASVQESRRVLTFDCEASIESTAGSASSRRSTREYGLRRGSGPWMVH